MSRVELNPFRRRVLDAIHFRSAQAAANGAMHTISGMQDAPHPADQLIGCALVLKNLSEITGISVPELFHVVDQMEADCRFRQVNTLSAVRMYLTEEIERKFR